MLQKPDVCFLAGVAVTLPEILCIPINPDCGFGGLEASMGSRSCCCSTGCLGSLFSYLEHLRRGEWDHGNLSHVRFLWSKGTAG